MNQQNSDYESPWKEALTDYFEQFMELCFPEVHADIDWSRGWETLDAELQEVIRDAEIGRRLADKLVKVYLRDGEEAIVLIHVEIQGKVQIDFAKRMYIYNNRLFDRYDKEVISLAVLGDDDPNWRPDAYGYSRWGFRRHLQFPVVKLLDYATNHTLEQDPNPFAVIIMAHLKTLETRGVPQQRLQSKLALVRGLYDRGYTKNMILELFRLIEWMMTLPPPLQLEFKTELNRIQEENRMPFMTSFEIDGRLKTAREYIIKVLETRFSAVTPAVSNSIESIEDLAALDRLLVSAVTVTSLAAFEEILSEI